MIAKTLTRIAVLGLACYGSLHLVGIATEASRAWPGAKSTSSGPPLTAEQQPIVSALSRLLDEDGVQQPVRWASAIVRSSPTTDLGYIALVTAQIRRESHFLAPDLEWVYQRVVPELVHSLGVDDPINTIGPMQVQRWRLHDHFEQALGTELDKQNVRDLSLDIETGVAACVAVLDDLVVEYVPDRRLRGWVFEPGKDGLREDVQALASDFLDPQDDVRQNVLQQKLLSDLTGTPLALDGVPGPNTESLLDRHSAYRDLEELRSAWQEQFRHDPPEGLPPRITHDTRLAFVLADFNAGAGASRIAALQSLTNLLFTTELAADGKWGPKTKAQMSKLLRAAVLDAAQRRDFEDLLESGNKRQWLRGQLLAMARKLYRERFGKDAPDALVPDFWFHGATQRIKGLGRISVAGYVAGSTQFYEDYLRRLCVYTGARPPGIEMPGLPPPSNK